MDAVEAGQRVEGRREAAGGEAEGAGLEAGLARLAEPAEWTLLLAWLIATAAKYVGDPELSPEIRADLLLASAQAHFLRGNFAEAAKLIMGAKNPIMLVGHAVHTTKSGEAVNRCSIGGVRPWWAESQPSS